MNQDIFKELKNLYDEIILHDRLYHQDDNPIISDYEYDTLCRQYDKLIKLFPNLGFLERKNVGFKPKEQFSKVKHIKPMLSLNNGFSFEDIDDFLNRTKKFLNLKQNVLEIVCEPKIDGLSISLSYKNGNLVSAVTRGDGETGELVTDNVLTINQIPKFLEKCPDLIEIRGEIYMLKADFEQLNHEQTKNSQKLFSNPRNAAAGSIRQKNPEITKSRKLNFVAYTIGKNPIIDNISKQSELLGVLKMWNFNTPEYWKIVRNLDEIKSFYKFMLNERELLDYEIDGLVYKVNEFDLQERLGNSAKAPRWAIAHKLPSLSVKTIIKNIDLQVGRTGAITPVARVKKINVGGVYVSNVSLHNEDEIKRKDIRIGDIVLIERAGDVIPHIKQVILNNKIERSEVFKMPKNCPSCNSITIKKKDEAVRRCLNSLNCKDQKIEKLIHFCSKNAFNIDGLGEKQINTFFNLNLISTYSDIFLLENHKSVILNLDGFGEISIKNLLNSINNSRSITFEKFLYSLGIRKIGQNNAKLLAKYFKNFENLKSEILQADDKHSQSYQDLIDIDQIGLGIVEDLILYFKNKDNLNEIENLINHIQIHTNNPKKIHSVFNEKRIVITGSFENLSRDEIKLKLNSLGAKVASQVSSKTDYLICGEKPGSKLSKALSLGINILYEKNFIIMLNKALQ